MSTVDYMLLSSTGPDTERIAFLFGLYGRTGVLNGRPAYKQLQSEDYMDNGNQSIYFCNGNWAVGPSLGKPKCFLMNFSESRTVPTSGWKTGIGGYLRSAPGLSLTRIPDLSSVLCSTITITARGEAARHARSHGTCNCTRTRGTQH